MEHLRVDFETQPIAAHPHYPPEPVGVALAGVHDDRYLRWGHKPDQPDAGARTLAATVLKRNKHPWLCHNAGFDIAVAMKHLGLPFPAAFDDTMILAFLVDPYSPTLQLKPLAERYLSMPPDEGEAIRTWLVYNKIIRKSLKKKWGAHIWEAPGVVVEGYALGDNVRSGKLFDRLYPIVVAQGMQGAYEREKALIPMLLENERDGIPINYKRLGSDLDVGEQYLVATDNRLGDALGKSVNLDSGAELAAALEKKFRIELPRTEDDNARTNRETLADFLPNGKIKGLLLYRSALNYQLKNFLRPWHAMATEEGKPLIHTHWNPIRGTSERKKGGGALTGRLSSEPNLQNLTDDEKYAELKKSLRKLLGEEPWLPQVRSYIEVPPGWMLFDRDFSQQEFRILAHFEDGVLQQAYNDDPDTDMHDFVRQLIIDTTGRSYDRKKRIKPVNFGKIYGAGVDQLAAQMQCTRDEAWEVKIAHETSLPSIVALQREMSAIGRNGEYITTIGGRRYHAERPRILKTGKRKGQLASFEYRLINYAIQGSAGDQTKQAMIDWYNSRLKGAQDKVRFLLTEHDQLVGMARKSEVMRESKALDECMVEAFKLDVPVRTTAVYGKNWSAMRKVI